ncbi:MAG: hypothetical protein ACRC1T_04380 [Clostridium chrysemydis]|uniref:hypothetical protein n=1 Tax=Clostridium chrysemydis TaxID=2665504 RepID=UPI003F2A1E70
MKSNNDSLKKRGFYEDGIVGKPLDKLEELLNSDSASDRTMAVRGLIELEKYNDLEVVHNLLEMLLKEKALYTRLEICEFLRLSGIKGAKLMVSYLGEIGNNQYKSVPKTVSRKKTYPLPRDLISRTFGHMDKEVMIVLLDVLRNGNRKAIAEVIDAIGFLVYHNRILSTEENVKEIILALKKYSNDDLLKWKLIICLSAFNKLEGKNELERIVSKSSGVIRMEAKRSLEFYRIR